jgi:hypothetical protein
MSCDFDCRFYRLKLTEQVNKGSGFDYDKREIEGSGFCDYDEEGNGQKSFAVVIDSCKCLDSVALQDQRRLYRFFRITIHLRCHVTHESCREK